jgi:hypothetical protein
MFREADPVESDMDMNYQAKEYVEITMFNFLHLQHFPVGLQLDGTNKQIPLLWPTIVSHNIDKTSPLDRMSPTQMEAMEIIVIMCGCGGSIDSLTSYTSKEIVWGSRFCHESVLDREGMITDWPGRQLEQK